MIYVPLSLIPLADYADQNRQLLAIMHDLSIPIHPNILEGNDENLRAQRLASILNDAMSNGDVIAVNTHCSSFHGTTKLLRPFIEQTQIGGNWYLNELGEYLHRHMPSLA